VPAVTKIDENRSGEHSNNYDIDKIIVPADGGKPACLGGAVDNTDLTGALWHGPDVCEERNYLNGNVVHHRELAGGRGFTAIMVSWLAKFNPIYMIITSFIIVFLQRGAGEISTTFGLNDSFSDILTGIIIFFIIGSEFFINYSIKRSESKKGGKE